jgi:hypothetical protein
VRSAQMREGERDVVGSPKKRGAPDQRGPTLDEAVTAHAPIHDPQVEYLIRELQFARLRYNNVVSQIGRLMMREKIEDKDRKRLLNKLWHFMRKDYEALEERQRAFYLASGSKYQS